MNNYFMDGFRDGIIKAFLCIFCFVVVWAFVSFIELQINPFLWEYSIRIISSFAVLLSSLILISWHSGLLLPEERVVPIRNVPLPATPVFYVATCRIQFPLFADRISFLNVDIRPRRFVTSVNDLIALMNDGRGSNMFGEFNSLIQYLGVAEMEIVINDGEHIIKFERNYFV